MKIELEYDPLTLQLTDPDKVVIATWGGLEKHAIKHDNTPKLNAADLVKLRDAGYSISDMAAMRQDGLI